VRKCAIIQPVSDDFDEVLSTRSASVSEMHRADWVGAEVAVVAGPDQGLSQRIGPAGIVIGTHPGCDLRLTDELVSRRHLEIRAEPKGIRVTDLESRNGTFFAGARVGDVVLTSDVILELGTTRLALRVSAEPLVVQFSPRTKFGDAVAVSHAMRHVFGLLEQAAKNDATVLLEGDSGTGKEVLSHALHQESTRREGPFVVVDCGAIPENLLESELFGHEKGAFTGAVASRAGAFEQADGGTLFLDEVGELPLEAQPKLLRALENRSFRRVGGSRTIQVDIRVVAATNRGLAEAVRRREFREDLFYRLAVVHIRVPRLADRKDDIAALAERFLQSATGDPNAKVSDDLSKLLIAYDWPGNARELRNVIERYATFDRADPELLFGAVRRSGESELSISLAALAGLSYHDAKKRLVESFHRALLPRAVENAGGSVPRAAEALGLPKASLYRMLAELKGDSDDDGA
jgi:transcriptional regulator with PAS, ATPase and Fis domain